MGYYELTRLGLQPVLDSMKQFMESKATRGAIDLSSEENVRDFINITYNQTVKVLFDAACQTVPRVKANALKFWWD